MDSANVEEWICKKESLSELGVCMSHLSSSPSSLLLLNLSD
jgi:hypothetical protein